MAPGTRIFIAAIPVATLVGLLSVCIAIFGPDSILGPSQVALLAAYGVCVALSMLVNRTPWKTFESAIAGNFGEVASAVIGWKIIRNK